MSIYQTTEYDTENQFDWDYIQYTIEDGVVIATRSGFDAGYEVFASYSSGDLTEEYFTGAGTLDALGFVNRTIRYDLDGNVSSQYTSYPDTLFANESFVGGSRTTVELQDGIFGDNVQPWSNITLTYDATGTSIDSRTTVYDDGTTLTDSFGVFGQLRSETQVDLDQSKSWLSKDTHFDENGVVEYRRTDFDNGIVRQDFFEDGVRIATAQTDNVYSNGDGIKSWTYIASEFDSQGKLSARTTEYDNGVLRTEAWENGLRTGFLQEDTRDAKNWTTISKDYDASGALSQQTTVFDNGDITVNLYDDGARVQRLRLDGDDSASWLVQVTDYGPDGRTTTTYTSVEDIPTDVLDVFPTLVPPAQLTEMVLDFNDNARLSDGDTALDGSFIVDVSKGENNIQGMVISNEYGGATEQDADYEAFNSWGSTVGFSSADGDEFVFSSVSLANASKSDTQYIPEYKWANQVTINGYNDGALVDQLIIGLTFDHVTHDVDMQGIDRVEFVASGGGITNDHVENAGWFSMDDLVFLA